MSSSTERFLAAGDAMAKLVLDVAHKPDVTADEWAALVATAGEWINARDSHERRSQIAAEFMQRMAEFEATEQARTGGA